MRRLFPSLLVGALLVGTGLVAWLGASMAPSDSTEGSLLTQVALATVRAGSARFTVTSVSRSPNTLQDDRSIGIGVVQFSADSARMVRIDHGHEILSGSGTVPLVDTTYLEVVHGRPYLYLEANAVGLHSALWISLPRSFDLKDPLRSLASVAGVSGLFSLSPASVKAVGSAQVGGVETQRYSIRLAPRCGVAANELPITSIWVDPLGRLVQLRQVVSLASPRQLRTTTVTTLRLHDFGAPVTIKPPMPPLLRRGLYQRGVTGSLGAENCPSRPSPGWVASGVS
ncbi:MAG: hypothetical protein ACRDYB_06180 [Acidimicrobiales bacterium]